jgi:hypothetical protein
MRKLVFLSSFIFLCLTSLASTDGPTTFDFIGIDTVSNSLYFTKLIGKECNCPVELWIYSLSDGKFEINKDWWDKYEYEKNKNEVLIKSKLNLLKQIDTVSNLKHQIYKINWLEIEKRYDPIVMDTVNYFPYQLELTDTVCKYGQLENKTKPKIRLYLLEEFNIGFLIIQPHSRLGVVEEIIFFEYPEKINETEQQNKQTRNSDDDNLNPGVIAALFLIFGSAIFAALRRRKRKK